MHVVCGVRVCPFNVYLILLYSSCGNMSRINMGCDTLSYKITLTEPDMSCIIVPKGTGGDLISIVYINI